MSVSKALLTSRAKKILITSDLLTTRAAVGLSSFMFSVILFGHYLTTLHLVDMFWVTFSMIHAMATFWSLVNDKINKCTFVGEAVFGFILWNYISFLLIFGFGQTINTYTTPAGAPLAPTFMVGIATWWILSRYPSPNNKK